MLHKQDARPGLTGPGEGSNAGSCVGKSNTPPTDILQGLPRKLRRRLMIDPTTGCWLWIGYRARDGYGQFSKWQAHRVIWQALVGEIEPRHVLDHVCRNRACCNPAHLQKITRFENTMSGLSPAAINARKLMCANGHAFDARNTYRYRRKRGCRRCNADAVKRYKSRTRADGK